MSTSYLCRIFKEATGTTINKYITAKRITLSKSLLDQGCSVSKPAKPAASTTTAIICVPSQKQSASLRKSTHSFTPDRLYLFLLLYLAYKFFYQPVYFIRLVRIGIMTSILYPFKRQPFSLMPFLIIAFG